MKKMEISRDFFVDVKLGAVTEQVHVVQFGAGDRNFVVWHSYDSVNRFYEWRSLKMCGQVTLVGLPGHGPVQGINPEYDNRWPANHFIDVGVEVVKKLSLGTSLTLVGHSTGAQVALGVASRLPDIVDGLVLINPLVWLPVNKISRWMINSSFWPLVGSIVLRRQYHLKRRSIESYLEGIRSIVGDRESFYGNPRILGYVKGGHEDYKQTSLKTLVNTVRVLAQSDLRLLLSDRQLITPALIVHGEVDPVCPVSQARWLHRHLPNAKLVVLPGVGHIGYGEREEEFEEVLLSWIRGKESFRPKAKKVGRKQQRLMTDV